MMPKRLTVNVPAVRERNARIALIVNAIERGYVWTHAHKFRMWVVRANGRPYVWATKPNHYRIPAKAGLQRAVHITHENIHQYLYSESDPNNPGVSHMTLDLYVNGQNHAHHQEEEVNG